MDGQIPELELDNQLCFAWYDASRAVVRAYGPYLDDLGLTYPQYVTMLVLWESDGPLSMGDLGARLHLDSGTLAPMIKRLVHLGVVERRRDPADDRRVLVTLTEQGAAIDKAHATSQIVCQVGSDWTHKPQARYATTSFVSPIQLRDAPTRRHEPPAGQPAWGLTYS